MKKRPLITRAAISRYRIIKKLGAGGWRAVV